MSESKVLHNKLINNFKIGWISCNRQHGIKTTITEKMGEQDHIDRLNDMMLKREEEDDITLREYENNEKIDYNDIVDENEYKNNIIGSVNMKVFSIATLINKMDEHRRNIDAKQSLINLFNGSNMVNADGLITDQQDTYYDKNVLSDMMNIDDIFMLEQQLEQIPKTGFDNLPDKKLDYYLESVAENLGCTYIWDDDVVMDEEYYRNLR